MNPLFPTRQYEVQDFIQICQNLNKLGQSNFEHIELNIDQDHQYYRPIAVSSPKGFKWFLALFYKPKIQRLHFATESLMDFLENNIGKEAVRKDLYDISHCDSIKSTLIHLRSRFAHRPQVNHVNDRLTSLINKIGSVSQQILQEKNNEADLHLQHAENERKFAKETTANLIEKAKIEAALILKTTKDEANGIKKSAEIQENKAKEVLQSANEEKKKIIYSAKQQGFSTKKAIPLQLSGITDKTLMALRENENNHDCVIRCVGEKDEEVDVPFSSSLLMGSSWFLKWHETNWNKSSPEQDSKESLDANDHPKKVIILKHLERENIPLQKNTAELFLDLLCGGKTKQTATSMDLFNLYLLTEFLNLEEISDEAIRLLNICCNQNSAAALDLALHYYKNFGAEDTYGDIIDIILSSIAEFSFEEYNALPNDKREEFDKLLKSLADANCSSAQVLLAILLYQDSSNFKKNENELLKLLEPFAKTESNNVANIWARYYLGSLYETKKDKLQAVIWYTRAADAGDLPHAQYKLFDLYDDPNLKKIISSQDQKNWFNKAIKHNYAPAIFRLGLFNFKGSKENNININSPKGVKLIEKSACLGFYPAQLEIARFYDKGVGVTQNNDSAISWFYSAANQRRCLNIRDQARQMLTGLKQALPD